MPSLAGRSVLIHHQYLLSEHNLPSCRNIRVFLPICCSDSLNKVAIKSESQNESEIFRAVERERILIALYLLSTIKIREISLYSRLLDQSQRSDLKLSDTRTGAQLGAGGAGDTRPLLHFILYLGTCL